MRPARGIGLCLFLSLVGIGLSGYLLFLHLGLLRGELLGGAACTDSGLFNCHAVTSGTWGSFLGIPLALWGILGYITVLALALLGAQSTEWARHALTLLFLLAALFVGIDLVLFGLMVFVIRFYCLFCLLTYAVNLSLLVVLARSLAYPWPGALRYGGAALVALLPTRARPAAWLFWGMIVLGLAGAGGLHASTTFLSRGTLGNVRNQLREVVLKQPRVSLEVAGDPRIGSPNAPLQLVEFSDFLCPACQRASKLNTIILANHRRDASFVFKHYPLDTTCNDKIQRMVHPNACQASAATECAHEQGRFWALHDHLFRKLKGTQYNVAELERDAEASGLSMTAFRECLQSGRGMEAVKRDIAEAARLGIRSTPTYVVNGLLMPGLLTPATFNELLDVLRETR
jgi:protein-disulfide isomerase/uncharacterized membrane protein